MNLFSIFSVIVGLGFTAAVNVTPARAEEPTAVCITDEIGTQVPYAEFLNYNDELLVPGPLGCRTSLGNPPKGTCWQVCYCVCRTENGNDPVNCWVQIPPGTAPDARRCPRGAECRTPKGTGMTADCRV